jgi:WD40 repeat protein
MVWDWETGKIKTKIDQHGDPVSAIGMSPDGNILATARFHDAHVELWDTANGNNLGFIPHGPGVTAVVFSPDGKTVATEAAGDNELAKLWNTETREERLTLRGEKDTTSGLVFSPDNKVVTTVSSTEFSPDTIPRLWSVATGDLLAEFDSPDLRPACVAFSPDGKSLAIGDWRAQINLFDVRTRARTRSLEYWCMVATVAFRSDGKTLVISGGIGRSGFPPEIVLWDLETERILRTLRPDPKDVSLVGHSFSAQALSRNGTLWVTACADGCVKVWSLD